MPFLLSYWKYILVAALLAGALVWINYNWETSAGIKRGAAETQAKWDAANAKQRAAELDKSTKAATTLEKGNASAKIVYRTITQTVDKIVTRDVYNNMCLDPDGLTAANDALAGVLSTKAPSK